MLDSHRPFVIDANVLFDVHRGGILTVALRAIDARVPDFVLHECQEPTRQQILGAGVREETFSPGEVRELVEIRARRPRVSLADASVFLVARREEGIILTRDEPLEDIAEEEGLSVAGTLDLVDLLVHDRRIHPERAVEAVQRMVEQDRPLPRGEVRDRLEAWGG